MKLLLITLVLTVACVIKAQKYTDKYDGMVIEDILSNRRLLKTYIKCVMEKGRCTPDGKELKSHISEALQNGCLKCTDTQRSGIRKAIKHLRDHERDSWRELKDKYDPKKVYSTIYERELKSLNRS